MPETDAGASARDAIHAVTLAVYEAIEKHPWVADQLTRPPWRSATLQILERLGRPVAALGIAAPAQFTAASALLLLHIVGAGRQEAINSHSPETHAGRQDNLDRVAAEWGQLDAAEYAFTRTMAAQLRDHDDRTEFLAGIDLILGGVEYLGHSTAGTTPQPRAGTRVQ
nr:TetR/AcrR family transcriptional regulator C-terminal domain-containing protein [Catenuloplanes niger]